jgi:Xaa-Pro aminopeptidase
VFDVVKSARDGALAFVEKAFAEKRSIHGWEVDDVARGIITDAGYGDRFIHRTGHSIGEETHGTGVHIDNLETQDDRLILPGSCFSLEPGIYLEGDFGVRLEIDVAIRGNEVLVFGKPIQEKIVSIV